MKEIKGDLFSCPNNSSLAHCISADVAMGKGIAVLFKKKFGGVQELKKQGDFTFKSSNPTNEQTSVINRQTM